MCGIAGMIKKKGTVDQHEIAAITSVLTHRGPDDTGFFVSDNVAIGHRRLSIIDLDTGKQPICNENQRIWLTCNGELYNYKTLKKQLQQAGHQFKSSSDSEVIVHAYEEWGSDCVSKFRGMFAFCILDLNDQTFFMARDHLGIKPLVYYKDDQTFAFSSEIQSFRKLENARLDWSLTALDHFLYLGYIPAPDTIYKQVKKLSPGHWMRVNFNGEIIRHERYWALQYKPDESLNEAQWLYALEEKIKDSIRHHLMSDVPFGAFLSGGIDSSLITTYMSEMISAPIQTYTIDFSEEGHSEKNYADIVAKKCRTNHTVQQVATDSIEILPDLVRHYGEPFGDSSAIPTYYVSQLASKQVKMVLSGDGGDESFLGYESYLNWYRYLQSERPVTTARQGIYRTLHKTFPFAFPYNGKPENHLGTWMRFMQYMNPEQRSILWKADYAQALKNANIELVEQFQSCQSKELLKQAQLFDVYSYLPNDILTKVDVASMMHGLEVRTPLIDKEVFEFAFTIPSSFNLNHDQTAGKRLLKQLLARHYDEAFVNRKKAGFSVPVNRWFSNQSSFQKSLQERVIHNNSPLTEFFTEEGINQIVNHDFKKMSWLLLFLDEWMRQNKH